MMTALLPPNAEFRAGGTMDVLVRRQSVPVYQSDDGTAGQNPADSAIRRRVEELKQSLNRLIAMLNDDLAA